MGNSAIRVSAVEPRSQGWSLVCGRRTEMAMTGLLERLKKGLAKTAQLFNIRSWFGRKVDQSFLDDLESRLIQADVGVAATTRIIDRVREAYSEKTADENLVKFVKDELKGLLEDPKAGNPSSRSQTADCLPDRRSQWLGQDHLDRQAFAVSQRSGKHDPAGRLRYLPRRGGRPALDLGRSGRLRDRQRSARGRSGQRGTRCLPAGTGPPYRRLDRRHRRAAAYSDASDARAREDPQRHPAAHPRCTS